MNQRNFFRIVLSTLTGGIAFALLPVGLLAFWIFLAQDNLVSEDDVSGLKKAGLVFGSVGCLIGFCSAVMKMRTLVAMAFGILLSLVLIAAAAIYQRRGLSEEAFVGALFFCLLPGILAGFVSSGVSRRIG